jgi:hypothetical protein
VLELRQHCVLLPDQQNAAIATLFPVQRIVMQGTAVSGVET